MSSELDKGCMDVKQGKQEDIEAWRASNQDIEFMVSDRSGLEGTWSAFRFRILLPVAGPNTVAVEIRSRFALALIGYGHAITRSAQFSFSFQLTTHLSLCYCTYDLRGLLYSGFVIFSYEQATLICPRQLRQDTSS